MVLRYDECPLQNSLHSSQIFLNRGAYNEKTMSDDKREVMLYAMALAEVFGFDEILADNMPISMHGAVIDSRDEKVIPIIYDRTRADPLVRTDKLEK